MFFSPIGENFVYFYANAFVYHTIMCVYRITQSRPLGNKKRVAGANTGVNTPYLNAGKYI